MLKSVSSKIADTLEGKGIIQESDKEVCAYGLRQMILSVLNFLTTLIIGLLMGRFVCAMIFTMAYIPLRIYAGGYHASTPKRCWVFSALMLIAALSILKYAPLLWLKNLTPLSLVSIAVIILLSPVEDVNKPLDDKEHRVYRVRAITVMLIEIIAFTAFLIFKLEIFFISMEISWFALSVILIIGKIKNHFIKDDFE